MSGSRHAYEIDLKFDRGEAVATDLVSSLAADDVFN
jgi:hypothetical protein